MIRFFLQQNRHSGLQTWTQNYGKSLSGGLPAAKANTLMGVSTNPLDVRKRFGIPENRCSFSQTKLIKHTQAYLEPDMKSHNYQQGIQN